MLTLSQKISAAIRGKRPAFTLAEVLIAASIFTIVSLIGVNVFINVIRIQRRVSLENAIYEDARVMMERIAREVRENTVDYEEYYNKASDFDISFSALPGLNLYGIDQNPYGNRYGCYSKRFYNPGTDGPEQGKFGAYCNNGTSTPESSPGCIVNKTTLDINTGQNPYAGYHTGLPSSLPDVANAMCDQNQITDADADTNCSDASPNHNEQAELYLINAKGNEKTILARKEIVSSGAEHALALLRLSGQDQDKDGVVEVWRDCDVGSAPGNSFCCSIGFSCSDPFATSTLEGTLKYNSNLYKGFVPISPTRTDVVALKFFVAPLEDPRKGFSETDPALGVQQQPHVTIVLTVKPAQSTLSGFTSGEVPVVTLQSTVTSRVYNEVRSYYTKLGVNGVCKAYVP